jgi:hypothetical protein
LIRNCRLSAIREAPWIQASGFWIPRPVSCILFPVSPIPVPQIPKSAFRFPRFRLSYLSFAICHLSYAALAASCSTEITKGRLVGDTGISSTESEKTNYPPNHLSEQTFVFTSPMGYESKHFATADDTKVALKTIEKLDSTANAHRFIAIPIAAAKGNSTTAEVMVYDTRRQSLVNDSVYRLANTPASGQTLKLDDITAIFESP